MIYKHPLILVTGATGAIGPLVVEALHIAGYRIQTLSLDPPPIGIWPDNVEALIGDVTDASDVQALPHRVWIRLSIWPLCKKNMRGLM